MQSKRRVTVLFTSVGRRVELIQAFRFAANKLGICLEIIGADITSSAPALRFCDKSIIVPRIADPQYIPTLMEICKMYSVDGLIPTIDTDLLVLSEHREVFRNKGTLVFVASKEKVAFCRDKRLTSDYFTSLGLHSPSPVDDIKKYTFGFPAFIKPIDGSSSIGAHQANNFEELRLYASQLDKYIVQRFISGTEYTVDIFCDENGEAVYITPRIRLAVRAGEVLKTQINHQQSIISEMQTLIQDFRPCGAITVQLIRDDYSGKNYYIEINPRFGGGVPLTIKAGADEAEAAIRMLLGEKLEYHDGAATEGAVFSRFDQSICINTPKQMVKGVIFDLDDTLYSEKEYIKSGFHAVALTLPHIEQAEQQLWNAFQAGKPAIDTVLLENGIYSMTLAQKCIGVYREHIPFIHLYSGAAELLQALKKRNIKLGIITDGRINGQKNKLDVLGLSDLVDSILITDSLGGPQFRKPNDVSFRVMQNRFQLPFEALVYVGDNASKDFQAPKSLGMQYIHFNNPDGLYFSLNASDEFTANSIQEISNLLLEPK